MPLLPLDHPEVKEAFQELLTHPKFYKFLEAFSDDIVISAFKQRLHEITSLTEEEVKQIVEEKQNSQPDHPKHKQEKKMPFDLF